MGKKEIPDEKFTLKKQADVAAALGVSIPTVSMWARQGMPGTRGSYPLPEIVTWLRTKGPWKSKRPDEVDPMLDSGDGPGIERYRQAKAALAELDLEERKGTVLRIEKARPIFQRWAVVIRSLGERLAKRFGNDAAIQVNDALSECGRIIENDLGAGKPADDSAT